MASETNSSERILVLVRGLRDAELTFAVLGRAAFEVLICSSVNELVERMRQGAGAALLEEEVVAPDAAIAALAESLREQPPWSDFPIIVFSTAGGSERGGTADLARLLGNVTFLERPIRIRSMVASVHAAIRSRRRQYEARRAIEARDTFLAMLGHELRNPLGAIRLATAMLERKVPPGSFPKEFAIIERQAQHLTRLVDDLLDVARVTQGKVTLARERLNVVEVARFAFEAQEVQAHQHGLSYAFSASPDVVSVEGDRQRLEQVFGNLITNAIKYTPRGGAIRLSVEREGDEAVVRVSDTGLGIAPEMVGHLFEAFAQADRTLARTEGGIGLGLALVRNLVQLHSGKVDGVSEGPNRGSLFTVRLPAAKEVVPLPMASNGAVPGGGPSRRVVVVEDAADIRELLAELLKHEGHQVSCAEDGPGGLATVLALGPDVAFIDIGLPGFDGLELARRARASGSRATLVAVTGYGQPEDRADAMDAGFDDHLTKPVVDLDVRRVMQRVPGRRAS